MPILRKILAAAAPLALLAVSACTQPFEAKVSRFQALPVPEGQTFTIEATDPRNQGGLEFAQYAGLVSQRLAAYGYRPAEGGKPELVVRFDYGVDKGTPKVVSRPAPGPAFGPWGYGGFGPYGRRWGYGSAFYYGWDPFFYDPWYRDIDTYTIYTSHADMTIERVADGKRLFEGKAKARSLDDSLPRLVPNLVEAMFTNFPGNSGEEVKITVAPPDKKK
ncbi:DUF4136 domain-containing protein [Sphingomonadaceae bacterium G21617-S1]|jgi:hypothetical protein|uniref:DUF4136 domain-containing protein n=1 Tax=Rhizorhabdus sp. TaxID=1968843 RepID=UPI00120B9D95|nr:DUF4136 domain-containing protein [Rhizorhabdus sp.]MBD3759765.1 DUF4136 domain-containing protein [Rhizorhabdus sp.]MCZ4342240.1 DUF4136 domain-containing protein [Sphingomonadaceae bacterium G21617-S1]TAK17602.1 MAG: DUF4136 domain-containing protein [Rhizorhabdus sp.]